MVLLGCCSSGVLLCVLSGGGWVFGSCFGVLVFGVLWVFVVLRSWSSAVCLVLAVSGCLCLLWGIGCCGLLLLVNLCGFGCVSLVLVGVVGCLDSCGNCWLWFVGGYR